MARTTRMKWMARLARISTASLNRHLHDEVVIFLRNTRAFVVYSFKEFRLQATAIPLYVTWVKTERLVRVPQTHIFFVRTCAGTLYQRRRVGLRMCLECLSLCAHQKSFVRLMFRRTLLDVPDPFSSFPFTPPPTQPSLLQTGMSVNTCAPIHGEVYCVAEWLNRALLTEV